MDTFVRFNTTLRSTLVLLVCGLFCTSSYTLLQSNGSSVWQETNVQAISTTVSFDTLTTNHTTLALNEDPTFLESQDINQLTIDIPSAVSSSSSGFGTSMVDITVATDNQCYVSVTNDFSGKIQNLAQYGYTFQLPSDTISAPFNFKARQDDVVEGPHTCAITYTYTFPSYPGLTQSQTILATVADYRPGVNANGPEILYEKPVEGQSSEGFVQLKLAMQPSDTQVVTANLTSLNPADCLLDSTNLTYTQTNWNSLQQIKVMAVKDGIYQPGTRDCKIRIVLNSGETPAVTYNNRFPIRAILANKEFAPKIAALEYNNVTQDIIVKVLDADTLPQTGLRNPWIFLISTVFLVASVLSAIYTYRAYRLQTVHEDVTQSKVQL